MTIIVTGYHDYLEKRGIVLKSVLADQFAGVLRSYRYGNACFPYFDFGGIASIERKNANFKCYKKVGINKLWRLKLMERDERPVICDVPIDALSYTRLRYDPTDQTRYFASGIQVSRPQWELLNALMQKYGSQKIEIILALDLIVRVLSLHFGQFQNSGLGHGFGLSALGLKPQAIIVRPYGSV